MSVNYVYIGKYITTAPSGALSLTLMALCKLLKHALLVYNSLSGFNYDIALISNKVTSVGYQVHYVNPWVSDDV
jgi:hypothetical protein